MVSTSHPVWIYPGLTLTVMGSAPILIPCPTLQMAPGVPTRTWVLVAAVVAAALGISPRPYLQLNYCAYFQVWASAAQLRPFLFV